MSGRYYAMDRDNRWDRVEKAYRAIVEAKAEHTAFTAHSGTEASLANGVSDEFVVPFVVQGYLGVDRERDAGLHFNFRPDRARELSRALAAPAFEEFARHGDAPFPHYACMTTYDAKLGLPIAFPKPTFPEIFPEVIARAGLTSSAAETEVRPRDVPSTAREESFPGEERAMIASPKDVATYDLAPAMSAAGVTEAVVAAIEKGTFDFVLVNYANPDMVGHTGVLGAAVEAVEAVDVGVGRIADAARAKGGAVLVTADHGNCELMIDPVTGNPHTAHTLNPVPLLFVDDARKGAKLRAGGRICDVADDARAAGSPARRR